jgi:hypothetical protein
LTQSTQIILSAADEGNQNDDWNRDAEHPKQYRSHRTLLVVLPLFQTVKFLRILRVNAITLPATNGPRISSTKGTAQQGNEKPQ